MGNNRQSRRLLPLVVSLTALMGIVVPAHAAQLRVQGSEIQYLAAPGETNRPQSELQGSTLGFRSTQIAPLTAGPGCSATTLASGRAGVACELEGITTVRLVLGDGDDEVSDEPGKVLSLPRISLVVDAGPGDDRLLLLHLVGLTGLTVLGGSGDDTVATPSSVQGTLKGGAGSDALLVYRFPTSKPQLVEGGAGNDSLRVQGTAGDVVRGGSGNDAIDTTSNPKHGAPDRVSCGPGNDRSARGRYSIRPKYDANDKVAADCERR